VIARLALLFATVTLLELSILIPLGQAIGLLPTVAVVLGTAVLGASLAKRQGLTIWRRIQNELASGQLPRDSLLDGLAVLIAGAFLLTPGVLTDIAGILLLLPPARVPIKALAEKYGKKLLDSPDVQVQQEGDVHARQGPFDVDQGRFDATRSGARRADNRDDRGETGRDREDDVIDVEPIDSDQSSSSDDSPPDDNHIDSIGELSSSTD